MKKILLTSLIFVGVAFMSTMFSCKVEPCKDVVCANSGTCNNGICACQVGYEGMHCETTMRDKFLGTFQVQEDGTLSPAALYTAYIEPGAVVNEVKIRNMQNGFTDPVVAIVKADTITIARQTVKHGTFDYTIEGQGFIKGTNPLDQHYYQHATVTLNYVVTDNLNQVNYYGSNGSLPSGWSK
jgi:hypothetical protein